MQTNIPDRRKPVEEDGWLAEKPPVQLPAAQLYLSWGLWLPAIILDILLKSRAVFLLVFYQARSVLRDG